MGSPNFVDKFYITNARLILPDKVIPQGTIVVKGKKIVAVLRRRAALPGAVNINARGNYLAPGFIDLHIHGDIEKISRGQIKGGTTGFLATLHPAKPKVLLKNIAQVIRQRPQVSGAKVLGIRLEGPFLNRSFCGALPPEALRPPDIDEAKRIISQAKGALKIVVLAPELKGALRLIRLLGRRRILASLGHTGASYIEAKRAIDAGARHATHIFNRMRAFDHRDPGATGAALTDGRVSCEVIPDGIHVHPAALKLLLACKGPQKSMLITDSTAAESYPRKRRCGDVFRLKDGTLYGTALTLNKALKNIVNFLGLSLPQAVRLITLNPAKLLKINQHKGSLAVGKDADIVIFDNAFKVKLTMGEGRIVYNELTA